MEDIGAVAAATDHHDSRSESASDTSYNAVSEFGRLSCPTKGRGKKLM